MYIYMRDIDRNRYRYRYKLLSAICHINEQVCKWLTKLAIGKIYYSLSLHQSLISIKYLNIKTKLKLNNCRSLFL